MGIYERPPAALLDALERHFGLPMPRQPGHNTVKCIQAMLAEEFGATVSANVPAGPVGTAEEVGKSLWVVSQA